MAFPGIIATLDDFNRADAPTLGANWETAIWANDFPIFSNTAGAAVQNLDQFATWQTTAFAANQRVWATVLFPGGALLADEFLWLAFRCPTSAALDGYFIKLTKSGATIEATLWRFFALLDTQNTGLADIVDGDFVGVDVVATTFTLYVGSSAATATAVAVFTDNGLTAGGYIGIGYRIDTV